MPRLDRGSLCPLSSIRHGGMDEALAVSAVLVADDAVADEFP